VTASEAGLVQVQAQAELERWYRRLLRAYPRSYRRAQGDDILATLMDAAEPGRSRPTRADVVDLARGALRQRFRLPMGVFPVVAAVLAALVLGAIGAASSSWLAWQTAANLPSNEAARQIGATVLGTPRPATTVNRNDGRRQNWPSVSVSYDPQQSDWTLASAHARLRAAGWTPGRVEQDVGTVGSSDDGPLEGMYQVFEAAHDGQVLQISALTITTPGHAGVLIHFNISAGEPAWAPVAVAVGWLVGAVLGWLLTAWAAYRLRRRALLSRLAALALSLIAIGLAAEPTIGLYTTLGHLAFGTIDIYGIAPPYKWVVSSPATGLVLGTLLAGTGVLILAAAGRRDTTQTATLA
jgi:hypothetical protein